MDVGCGVGSKWSGNRASGLKEGFLEGCRVVTGCLDGIDDGYKVGREVEGEWVVGSLVGIEVIGERDGWNVGIEVGLKLGASEGFEEKEGFEEGFECGEKEGCPAQKKQTDWLIYSNLTRGNEGPNIFKLDNENKSKISFIIGQTAVSCWRSNKLRLNVSKPL